MNFLLRHRRAIRIILIIVTLCLILAVNIFLVSAETTSTSQQVTIALLVMGMLTEFLPEIVVWINARFGPSDYLVFMANCLDEYQAFIQEYFVTDCGLEMEVTREDSLFPKLEEFTLQIDGLVFGTTQTSDKRRRPIAILLFLIRYSEKLQIEDHENLISYIKLKFKAMSKQTGRKEFVYAYDQLALQDKHYVNPNQYFAPLEEEAYEAARLRFFDRYMKDDYIVEIANILQLNKAQIASFKNSVRTVAESDQFNLKYLRDYVQKRRTFKKLFVVTADIRFSKPVQNWIRQQPHFILFYSSIANLPRIGISGKFDIFFFSPEKLYPSASALYEKFIRIDPSVENHPIRIFEVDPSEGLRNSLSKPSAFGQAISYFEASTFDPTALEDLSYNQLISILEKRKVSLQSIITDLPPSEFTNSIRSTEKPLINSILSEFIPDEAEGVFALTGVGLADIRQAFSNFGNTDISYSAEEIVDLYSGNVTEAKKRARVTEVFRDIKKNLKILDEFIE